MVNTNSNEYQDSREVGDDEVYRNFAFTARTETDQISLSRNEIMKKKTSYTKSLEYSAYVAALHTIKESKEDRFLFDSGADEYLVGGQKYLTDCRPVENYNIQCARKGQNMEAVVKGDMTVEVMNRYEEQKKMKLVDVLYVSGLHENLLSEHKLTEQGLHFLFTHNYVDVIVPETGDILFSGKREG